MPDKYYLEQSPMKETEQMAIDLQDDVETAGDDGKTFHVPSHSREDEVHTVELAVVTENNLPPFSKPKCHHILAVEMSSGQSVYHNSYGNERAQDPDKYLIGRCTCEKFTFESKNDLSPKFTKSSEAEEEPETTPEVVDEDPKPQKSGQLADLVAGVDQIRKRYQKFEQLKRNLLTKSDMQKAGKNAFVKKSGWRKVATAFGLSLEKIETDTYKENGFKVVEVTYRAHAPTGQYQDGSARCSFGESNIQGRVATAEKKASNYNDEDKAKRKVEGTLAKLEHDVFATAETRAKNRAISDLVGGGEVSYEEVNNE